MAGPRALLVDLQIARRSARRYATYRVASVSGAMTNSVFGVISASVLVAVWHARGSVGGYEVADAVTYVFVAQALLMPVAVFGGLELADRIRSGDVAVDLLRPVGLLRWWLGADLGRAAYQLVVRGVPPFAAGALLFPLRAPTTTALPALAVSLVLAVLVSFALRYLVALTAFWLLDDRGVSSVAGLLMVFFSGSLLPLVLFPPWLAGIARALPWSATIQVPSDVFLGKTAGAATVGALAFQALWAAALLCCCAGATRIALRHVVAQGG